MYMDRMLSIGKVENGFVVEVHVPLKREAKAGGKNEPVCYYSGCDKKFIAQDGGEVGALVDKLMGMIDMEYKSEEDFDSAFKKAAGGMSGK